ncbi:MAG: DUF4235 domain-containing protein [Actinobacteria bacterium]|nr:DUF4235 domain-containing protein [Actinomycetota bacterium]
MSRATKAMYVPLSIVTSAVGGMLATAMFGQIWKRVDDSGEGPPDPKDLNRSAATAFAGAALQGLVFGLVRAAIDRAGARGYQAVTNESPI